MGLLKDVNFVMFHIIRKMLLLLRNYLNYLKDDIFECFEGSIISFYFSKTIIYIHNIIIESLSLEEENIIKDITNLLD